MAKQIPDIMVPDIVKAAPRTDYNWEQYADGKWWQLKKGEDYTVMTASARTAVTKWGEREGLTVETANLKDEDGFVLRIK